MKMKRGKGHGFTVTPCPQIVCRGQDLNLHTLASTSTSSWRVCQFRHPGNEYHIILPPKGVSSPH